jgi:hypothetical protein
VPLITLLEMAGADLKKGRFVLAEGAAVPLGVIHIHDCLRAGIA